MCGRYALYETKDLGPRFNLATQPTFVSKDNYNVAPRQRLPIIVQDQEQGRRAEIMQWGFIPPWSKDPSKGSRPINTMSETAFAKPMWKCAVMHHRCLVPSRGFYEWEHINDQVKVPYFIHPKDQALFSFAGIYSVWHDVEDKPLYSFSIMTTAPNRDMEPIHDRMPVILHPDQEATWLDPQYSEQAQLASLLIPYEDGMLDMYRVSDDVNSPRHNDKHLVEAVAT
ncbi:MAG TPA: SOS response-associated peptidase [Ktedonobacteraceae bacterium]|nr:SOS response-associated peptidase [Ktedonobacteraceae bacterium]